MHVDGGLKRQPRKIGNVNIHETQRRMIGKHMPTALFTLLAIALFCEMELANLVGTR